MQLDAASFKKGILTPQQNGLVGSAACLIDPSGSVDRGAGGLAVAKQGGESRDGPRWEWKMPQLRGTSPGHVFCC